jgi:predicted nucleic acid-binding protein
VLLKLFVQEHDSALFAILIQEPGAVIHTSELSRLELFRALCSKRLEGAIRQRAEEKLMRRFESELDKQRIILVPNGREILRQFELVVKVCYTRPRPILVRNLDAMHLASALASKATQIVCSDMRMRAAADALQMDVYPPRVA